MPSRRQFLLAGPGLAAAAGLVGCRRRAGSAPPPLVHFPGEEGLTLHAIVEQLIPEGPGPLPGARQAGVARYIDRAVTHRALGDIRGLLGRGLRGLAQVTRTERGRPFHELSAADQQATLQRLEEGALPLPGVRGERFFEVLLSLSLEGYLGAPEHGGNADGRVWQAIGFAPDAHGGHGASPVAKDGGKPG